MCFFFFHLILRSSSFLSTLIDLEIPVLPKGQKLVMNVRNTWGDRHYVGLNGMEVFSELGLQTAYSGDDAVYRYIRKIMALPFLPYREILPMFVRLEAQAQTVDQKPGVYSEKLVRLQTADPD